MAKASDWFSWKLGEELKSARLEEVAAVKVRPSPGASVLYLRSGVALEMSHDDAAKLKKELKIK